MTTNSSHDHKRLPALILGAIGVVFGDIGTSPLYAIKEAFHAFHLPTDSLHIYGMMSLVFWLMFGIVSVKYIMFIMRADNKGEGGNLALLALAKRLTRKVPQLYKVLGVIGMLGGSLFFADAVITPAISVMSAIEGLEIVRPNLSNFILPLSLSILFMLFAMQHYGTSHIGKLFGPIMLLWFTTLGVLGVYNIVQTPEILQAVSPHYAWMFFLEHPALSFWTLGAAILVVTGAEALYADMGHFGRKPIQLGWFFFVWPCLLLNYFGQSALLIRVPQSIENPFYLMAPEWFLMPLLILATFATVIASQAVITGTFSVVRQAILLGYLPRLQIQHTSDHTKGQIYIPTVNWMMFFTIAIIVLVFKSSSSLAAAYGMAVSGNMLMTTLLFCVVARMLWRWSWPAVLVFGGIFVTTEIFLLTANVIKIAHGAWLPLAFSAVLVLLFSTWSRGQQLLNDQRRQHSVPPETYVKTLEENTCARVSGTAFYLGRQRGMVPPSFITQIKHTRALHEQIVFLTIQIDESPYLLSRERCEFHDLGKGFKRLILHYGFKEIPDLARDLELCRGQGLNFNMNTSSFFLGSESIVPTAGFGMPLWRDWIFMMMKRNSGDVVSYLNLPHDRVVELKSQHIV